MYMESNFGRERENSNSKTLILKSIWTYLTASPCYTTNTNKHGYTTNRNYKHKRERGRDRQTDRDNRQTDSERETDRQTDIDRETERQTDRDRQRRKTQDILLNKQYMFISRGNRHRERDRDRDRESSLRRQPAETECGHGETDCRAFSVGEQ